MELIESRVETATVLGAARGVRSRRGRNRPAKPPRTMVCKLTRGTPSDNQSRIDVNGVVP